MVAVEPERERFEPGVVISVTDVIAAAGIMERTKRKTSNVVGIDLPSLWMATLSDESKNWKPGTCGWIALPFGSKAVDETRLASHSRHPPNTCTIDVLTRLTW